MPQSPMLGESGYERLADDGYFTEAWVTRALAETGLIRGPVWEPAVGRGDLRDALIECGVAVPCYSDIRDRGYPGTVIRSFLTYQSMPGQGLTKPDPPVSIVTNPPYANGGEFVAHAIELARETEGQVWMLLRNEFDCAARRQKLFSHPAFAYKAVLTRRPRWDWWLPDAKDGAPRHNFAWFGWDWRNTARPTILYIPIAIGGLDVDDRA